MSQPSATSMPSWRGAAARYFALLTGRRSTWAVFVLWLALFAGIGALGSKIGSVQNNEAQTWLPANAQSTRAASDPDSGGPPGAWDPRARSPAPVPTRLTPPAPADDACLRCMPCRASSGRLLSTARS